VEDSFRLPAQNWDLTALGPPRVCCPETAAGPETAGPKTAGPNTAGPDTASHASDPHCSDRSAAHGPAMLMVKIFQWPLIDWEHYNNVLPFNKIAPLFTDSEYWRGDMLLVCYEYRPAFLYN
jgi:hypothetical protein